MKNIKAVKDVIYNTKELIGTEDTWIKNALCKDKDGKIRSECDLHNNEIVSWCALGALLKTHRKLSFDNPSVFIESLLVIVKHIDDNFTDSKTSNKLAKYSDAHETTHADIMSLFDKSIEYVDTKHGVS